MSEGELKKHVWKTQNNYVNMPLSEFVNILNEADRDFPDEKAFYGNPNLPDGKLDYEGFINKVQAWRKKWFGETRP